ncbi:LytR/AlgR family response regulator transcription factor [Mucilaginibacter ginkgonis]|uniref:LytR/AlgR family response regulator transcription factor n=1 Tax=Mucilaginibacter ginkgonis TaxID=2682091 RepID=UPI0012FC10B9|nr:LytTR family DNA-binding domain-containing protein [Mucilaginibacter ginkgonis]
MIKAIAVDDEPFALEVIRAHAAKVPFLELAQCFTNAFEAIAYLAKNKTDLIFLDIKMPDISGIELAESLPQKPLTIFTTAFAEHAVQSYELNAVDYLLKPFSFARFLKACNKVNDMLNASGQNGSAGESIFIKTGYESVKVNFDDILCLESGGNYITFVLTSGKSLLSRLTMTEAIDLIPANKFNRVHRSYIVNKNKVCKIERHQLQLDGGYTVPVSQSYFKGF